MLASIATVLASVGLHFMNHLKTAFIDEKVKDLMQNQGGDDDSFEKKTAKFLKYANNTALFIYIGFVAAITIGFGASFNEARKESEIIPFAENFLFTIENKIFFKPIYDSTTCSCLSYPAVIGLSSFSLC